MVGSLLAGTDETPGDVFLLTITRESPNYLSRA